jgi:hypothetical protein
MRPKQNNQAFISGSDTGRRSILSNVDLKILWVSRTLSDIDYKYEPEFLRITQSLIHKDLKKLMREALISSYRQKRAPYVKLLTELRNQQRKALTSKG